MAFDSYTIDIYEELNNKLKIFTTVEQKNMKNIVYRLFCWRVYIKPV
jgi:hypothetical protein